MKKQQCNILLVDDHPLITDAYKNAFEDVRKKDGIDFDIVTAHSCDAALHILHSSSPLNTIDIVFLDIQLPPSSEENGVISGEDLGLNIRKTSPQTKIVVATTFNDHYRIHSIFESLNPDGFLIKNDVTPGELVTAISRLMNDPPYYSKTVIQSLRKYVTNDLLLDKIDRQLLYQLSLGTRMKTMSTILPLSRAAIEKRKRHLKEIFDIRSGEDRELIFKAREKGFI
ncbi:response regulator [Sinomicrobium weinanense]|uniref:Response regulator transcription factor n=1 Tax=Sinomicrobium weinanense TaxID=2842200 RepID=A0A926JPL8_9FLAO|nr:response regulator [Sinomicrobium weinanense]MBC9795133.1 response regulator transcription factor [Sinomicrobium weinanense]MBU3123735.1 response regulator [Sinomicrobium weinanense]